MIGMIYKQILFLFYSLLGIVGRSGMIFLNGMSGNTLKKLANTLQFASLDSGFLGFPIHLYYYRFSGIIIDAMRYAKIPGNGLKIVTITHASRIMLGSIFRKFAMPPHTPASILFLLL